MRDILDNLFGVLPIVLAVLWILRRVSTRRSREQKPEASAPDALRAWSSSAEQESGPESSPRRLAAKIEKASRNVLGGMSREVLLGEPAPRPVGEEELYDRIQERRIAVPPPVKGAREVKTTHRIIDPSPKNSPPTIRSKAILSLDRIDNLPPIARGMVWSIILDEPPGVKGL